MVDSLLSTGVNGIQRGVETAREAASDIAKAGTVNEEDAATLPELAESAVKLIQAEQQVAASAAVVRTADELLGTIIDTKA